MGLISALRMEISHHRLAQNQSSLHLDQGVGMTIMLTRACLVFNDAVYFMSLLDWRPYLIGSRITELQRIIELGLRKKGIQRYYKLLAKVAQQRKLPDT